MSEPVIPPAPQQPPSPEPPPKPKRLQWLRSLGGGALRLYGNVDKLDRWGGGGIGFSTVVRIAGWAGLIAVLAVLVTKIRDIQAELDPVAHGVEKLQDELDIARSKLRTQSDRSMKEIDQLRDQAHGLRVEVQKTAEIDAKAGSEVKGAQRTASELREVLEQRVADAKAIDDQQKALDSALTNLGKAVEKSRGAFQGSADSAAASLKQLQDALAAVQSRASDLDKAVAALPVSGAQQALARVQASAHSAADALDKTAAKAAPVQAALAKLQADAEALSAAMERATEHVNAMDTTLAKKADSKKAAAATP